ncbi:MAG TPA: asparagine synthase (glutamine-hydrolyzing) [Steroidobacteraceae bacterium]|jgi:asparagine synthase (glutamine-hydrolysing)|nr:asparagine synthase (glutamine-hydrolyzing) [Steroidobacteraceae bacterium]
MCGICGFLVKDGLISEDRLLAMNDRITRRGPDGAGHFYDGSVGLAMRRLAIIDLNGGRQPIFNEDRTVCVVFNGEIYNYRQLRRTLESKGHRFATDSDTEVLVHLYEEHGADLPSHLEGMFAFALWDLKTRTLLLGRDRLGIKPLFIARTSAGIVFGSEIKCLLASGAVSTEMDFQALDEYFTYTNVPCPRTIYRDIRQLAPGATLTCRADGFEQQATYWRLPQGTDDSRSESEWHADCETALRAAVESHLVSDVPVGAFLSGGVDSGVMVAMMADILGKPVETFTVGFNNAGSSFIDERVYARALATRYGLNHHEIDVTPNFEEIVADVVTAFDQPFADDSVVPSYYVSKIAGSKVKVALTGLGGDELFGGYRRHLGVVLAERYSGVPRWLRERVVRPLIQSIPESANSSDAVDHLKRFVRAASMDAPARYQDNMATLSWITRNELYKPDVAGRMDAAQTAQVMCGPFQEGRIASQLERALRTDLQTYLMDDILTLSDRLSMWHSLELRVPYLDHRLVELTARMPASLKVRGFKQKYLLKRIAERWLPRDMIYHKKQGFEAPMGRWLRGPLLPFFDSVVSRDSIERDGLFNFATIRKLRDEHVGLKKKHSKILFSLLMFQLWRAGAAH